ncbi:hypothetical protein BC332_23599 [Capsicum chinense]|nr:hypothetical protein BC332_23599 [Capsicum chinense]
MDSIRILISMGEVLLKLETTSIKPVDCKIQKDMLQPLIPSKFPFKPIFYIDFGCNSYQCKGDVVEVGANVRSFKAGDKGMAMLNTLKSLIVTKPAELSTAEGAGLFVAGITGLQALVDPTEVKLDGVKNRSLS